MKARTIYDVAAKMQLVEDYLEKKKLDEKLSQTKYSKEFGIPYQTFNCWIKAYENNGNSLYPKEKNNDEVEVNSKRPQFIELSEDTITNVIDCPASVIEKNKVENIKLDFKGVSLEFSGVHLSEVLEIIRKW